MPTNDLVGGFHYEKVDLELIGTLAQADGSDDLFVSVNGNNITVTNADMKMWVNYQKDQAA